MNVVDSTTFSMNFISTTASELPPTTLVAYTVYVPLITILSTLGTVFNGLVIFTILRVKTLQKTYNVFVLNLAFADILVSGFYGTFLIYGIVKNGWFLPESLCIFLAALVLSFAMVSNICMTFIGMNRYCLVVKGAPASRKIFSPLYTGFMVTASWVWGIAFVIPPLVGLGELGFNEGLIACMFISGDSTQASCFWNHRTTADTMYCYIQIYITVRASRLRVQQETTGRDNERKKADLKLTKDLFIMYGVFCFCTIPNSLAHALDTNQELLPGFVHSLTGISMWSNSVWNPLILSWRNEQFKAALRKSFNLRKVDECDNRKQRKM